MNKKNTFLALLFVLPLSLFAQNIKLSGTVKDSIGNPLELANIIATVKSSGAIESYGITDARGRYKLSLPKGDIYELKVSYLGLKTLVDEIAVPEDGGDITRDFVLISDPNQLEDVELVYEIPVTIKGDTIVYNADSFTNGDEKKLGDVLDKLPGVEVNEDGEIEVEGKTVSKVMVEGKEFFDGDSKLATENIPADAVKKVEVLKNYNEVSQMRGLGNDQDNIAINIKLKEGKKNFWFGDITAGGGYGEHGRYLVKPKLFYYSPKGSINIISNFNNTGDVPFTFRDYFNFTGGFRNFNQRGGTSFNVSDSGLGFLVTQNNRANELESGFAAANFTYTASPALDISGFALLSDNRTDFVNNSLNTFINEGFTQEFNQISEQQNQLAMAKFSAVYKPNANFQMDYDVLGKLAGQEETSVGISREFRVNGITEDTVDENKDNETYSINQNVNTYYTLNDKNIFAGTLRHLYQNEDPFYQALLSQEPLTNQVPEFIIDPSTGMQIPNPDPNAGQTLRVLPLDTTGISIFDVNQNRKIKTNKLDAKIDYYYVLNKKSNLNFTLGTTLNRQDFDSDLFQILNNGSRLNLTQTLNNNPQSLSNDVRFNFSDVFLGLHYKVKTGKFTFTPGVTLHNYTVASEQQGSRTSENKTLLLPDLFVDFQIRQSQNIRFNYQATAQYTDVNNYAEGLILNNYNALSGGNRNLDNALYHNLSLNYFSFSMFNFTSLFGGINYSYRADPIKTVGIFNGINQVSSPVNNVNFADQTLSANARFSKTFKKLKWNIRGSVSYSDLNNIINGQNRNTQNWNQNYNTSVSTNFKDAPNFEVGFNRQITNSDNGFTNTTFTTDRPFANAQVNFLKGFTFEADWSYFNYDDNDDATDISNTYQFLEANLYYQKKDSKWEFRVQATNLLDVDVISNNNVNDIRISSTEYFVQPRIVMFTVKYDL